MIYIEITHNPSEKSVVVLDGTKQLRCVFVLAGYRRERQTDWFHLFAPLHVLTQAYFAYGRDGSLCLITNDITTSSLQVTVLFATIYIRAEHSTFAEEWNVYKASIASLIVESKLRCLLQTWSDDRFTWTTEWKNVVFTDESLFCLQHHDVRMSLEILLRETAGLLRYASTYLSYTLNTTFASPQYTMPVE